MKEKATKNILIIGASLYGCLLAYQFSKDKKNKVYLVDGSRKILSSLNEIKINSLKLNNGFHGIEIPRATDFVNFLIKKLKIKLHINDKIQKMLLDRFIVDYKDNYNQWPESIRVNLKKNFLIKKKDRFNKFYTSGLLKLIDNCATRFNKDKNQYRHLFLPWFLPSEYKLQSKDEGDMFRQKVRENRIMFKYAVPKTKLFSALQKKFDQFLRKKGVKIILESSVKFKKKSLFFEDNVDLNNQKFDHVFFCAPLAFILKTLNPNHLKRIISYKRYLLNVLIKVNKKINFTEMICLNKKLQGLNRISVVKKSNLKNNSILQLEIIQKEDNLKVIDQKNIKNEIQKIFQLKKKPNLLGYKTSRVMFFPNKAWNLKSIKIIKDWKKNFETKINLRYSFGPINMAKAWIYSEEDSKLND